MLDYLSYNIPSGKSSFSLLHFFCNLEAHWFTIDLHHKRLERAIVVHGLGSQLVFNSVCFENLNL